MMHVLLMLLSEWREFRSSLCPAGKKSMTTRFSEICKSPTSPEMLLSPSETRRDLQFGTWTNPFSNDTIDFVLRRREVGRAKELSEHPRISNFHSGRRIKMICANCHCENNKTLLLINTTFPPSTTSADKLFCNWEGKKRKQTWQINWIHTDQSDCNLHNVLDVATT